MCFQTRTRNQDSILPSNSRYEITLRRGNRDSRNTPSAKNTLTKRDAEHLHQLLGLFAETKPQTPPLSEQPAALTSYAHIKYFTWCFCFFSISTSPLPASVSLQLRASSPKNLKYLVFECNWTSGKGTVQTKVMVSLLSLRLHAHPPAAL